MIALNKHSFEERIGLTESKEDRLRARNSSLDLDQESLHALAEAFVQLGT
jgi:hypothetical protein